MVPPRHADPFSRFMAFRTGGMMQAARQARALITREKILQEATRLFTLKGYHDTKLDEILRAAGVTSGAFFHHFRSKEDLAVAVMDWYTEQRRHELSQIEQGLRPAASDTNALGVVRYMGRPNFSVASRSSQ